MNGKTRITKVMDFELPDHVPFDGLLPTRSDIFYIAMVPAKSWQPPDQPGVFPNVYPEILKLGLWKWHPTWDYPKNWQKMPRSAVDPFGCVWDYAANDVTKGHPGAAQPMKSLEEIGDWPLPDPFDPTQYRFFGKASKLFPRKYKVGLLDSLLFARVQYLRGFSQSLIDLMRNQTQIKHLVERLTEYYLGAIEMFHKVGAQAVYGQDDMGSQTDLFMSPRLYKQVFAPAYKKLTQRAHELEMKFILHSCGQISKLVPIWIDCGIDALQLDSPRMSGLDNLTPYAGKIGFHCVPDIQTIYPFATPVELEAEIKTMIQAFGPAGGLVIRDYMQAVKVLQVPLENKQALPKLVKKWGKYPLSWV